MRSTPYNPIAARTSASAPNPPASPAISRWSANVRIELPPDCVVTPNSGRFGSIDCNHARTALVNARGSPSVRAIERQPRSSILGVRENYAMSRMSDATLSYFAVLHHADDLTWRLFSGGKTGELSAREARRGEVGLGEMLVHHRDQRRTLAVALVEQAAGDWNVSASSKRNPARPPET